MIKHLVISAAAMALTGLAATPAAAAGGKDRLAVCHFSGQMRDTTEDRTGRVLVLPIRPAIAAHTLNHDDVPLILTPLSMRTEPFRTGEECTVDRARGGLTGAVRVGGEIIFPALTEAQVQQLLVALVNDPDNGLSPADRAFLLRLIAQAFS